MLLLTERFRRNHTDTGYLCIRIISTTGDLPIPAQCIWHLYYTSGCHYSCYVRLTLSIVWISLGSCFLFVQHSLSERLHKLLTLLFGESYPAAHSVVSLVPIPYADFRLTAVPCDYFAQKTSRCMGTGRYTCVFIMAGKIAEPLTAWNHFNPLQIKKPLARPTVSLII